MGTGVPRPRVRNGRECVYVPQGRKRKRGSVGGTQPTQGHTPKCVPKSVKQLCIAFRQNRHFCVLTPLPGGQKARKKHSHGVFIGRLCQ